jgi:hypothetical protein
VYYFIASINLNVLHSAKKNGLIRIITPVGTPHIAVKDLEMAHKIIGMKRMEKFCTVISESELNSEYEFDFANGLLILDSSQLVHAFLSQPELFDYQKHIVWDYGVKKKCFSKHTP